jgi:AraC family transcriptional regulator of adaptative response / DNA-3-methyladenine glycosylase II
MSGSVSTGGPSGTTLAFMHGYSAVVTTGIYCLPECSGKPLARNVRPYGHAAAAEAAGYRACMRCRPYRREQPLGWTGPELLCRAVQLIVDGALDDGNEDRLASTVGLSARHLRRLFLEHVGVTPVQLARSRRAHFARRLLDDTDLTIGEIAFAAGFGSIRQLNRTMTEIFQATPRGLRDRRRVADRLVADGGLALRLSFTPPFDWDAMLGYLAGRAIRGVEAVDREAGVYRRTISVRGNPGVIEVARGGADHLVLRTHLPHWEGLIHHVARVRRIFRLELDPAEVLDALGGDSMIGPLVRADPGVRMPGTWDLLEVGVRAIIGQQVSVAGANTITGRLVARHGAEVPGLTAMGLTHLFPAAELLADPATDLDGLGLTNGRIAAIRAFAAGVRDGDVVLDRGAPLERFTSSIEALPGSGPWTAHYVALRLGEPDAFPASDLGLRLGAARLVGHEVSAAELAARAERWRPWRSSAAIHLWRVASP